MKRINFNIKDRKFLITTLSLVMVCVFTLSIAYSALSAVLTISGNARVSAADWDIYLNDPRVTSGSVTTDVPVIKTSNTLEFSTILNMPGDFYEFVVDVVNDGSIDAMIENVVKNPELTAEQAKYLKYEVSYQNGEAITTKQLLAKDSTIPIKVRIEYRKDLSNSDLPTGQVVLDLSLTLEYIQSDGTGSEVVGSNDYNIGDVLSIGGEVFYVIGEDSDNVKLLAMFNLGVGNQIYEDFSAVPISNPTGVQSYRAVGAIYNYDNNPTGFPWYGTVEFSNSEKHGNSYTDYEGSLVEEYVNNYVNILETDYDADIIESRLITYEDLIDGDLISCYGEHLCDLNYDWLYSSSYWCGTTSMENFLYVITTSGTLEHTQYSDFRSSGVRPVIVVSKEYFNSRSDIPR